MDTARAIIESTGYIIPEIILIGGIIVLLIMETAGVKREVINSLSISSVILSLISVLLETGSGTVPIFSGMVRLDTFSFFFRIFFLLLGGIILLFSLTSKETERFEKGEFTSLILGLTAGMVFLSISTNLLMVYLSMEFVSFTSYFLTGFPRGDVRAKEASIKYIVFGAASSGIMIFGISLLYGLTGSLDFYSLKTVIGTSGIPLPATFLAVIFIIAGFGFKIALVPFHFWCPDVYEGAPTPITAFLSVGPKVAGLSVLIRFFYTLFTEGGGEGISLQGGVDFPLLLSIVSALTMTLGNLAAIPQNNIKRLLAYSSIAHAGYILMGFVLLMREGISGMLFYMVIYLFMNTGAFLMVASVRDMTGSEDISVYKGLGWRLPFIGVSFTIFLFSLVGIPPFAGFVAKVLIFAPVIDRGLYWLAIVGVLNSVVSLYYYARIVKAMFLEYPDDPADKGAGQPLLTRVLTVALLIPVLFFGIFWSWLFDFTRGAVALFFESW